MLRREGSQSPAVLEARMALASGSLSRAVLVRFKWLACSMIDAFVRAVRDDFLKKSRSARPHFPLTLVTDEKLNSSYLRSKSLAMRPVRFLLAVALLTVFCSAASAQHRFKVTKVPAGRLRPAGQCGLASVVLVKAGVGILRPPPAARPWRPARDTKEKNEFRPLS
ncbi:MAG TPA: hypothetical protein VGX78_18085 [Pirellulales bacterium]|jgi:hypothetical protein|nr:hypothetical protein [Pirellulales bacterium]